MNFYDALNLLGGLALFLIGMKLLSDYLQKVAGDKMRQILKKATNTPFRGVFLGTVVTSVIQSSSATTVMLVGLVNAGIITLKQSIGVIMGANIGTTMTAQLIAFQLSDVCSLFIIIGVIMLFNQKNRKIEEWGWIIFGFGLLFFGLNIMSGSLSPLKDSELAHNLFITLSSNPFLGILTGTLFTMIIQSSSASVGLVMTLASNGLIPFEGAIYLILGDNIGTTITAWLASIPANRVAKRVALIHSLFNVFGTLIFGTLTYLQLYPQFIDFITPGPITHSTIARHLANSHSFFNILNTLIFLPFANVYEKIALRLIKGDLIEDENIYGEPKYINQQLLTTPEFAIEQSIQEMKEMLKISKKAINLSIDGFLKKNYKAFKNVEKLENAIDNLQKEITLFLIKVSEQNLSDTSSRKIPSLLHSVHDLERLGDHAINLNEIFERILNQKIEFKTEFIEEIKRSQNHINHMIDHVQNYMDSFDALESYRVIELEGTINQYQIDLRSNVITMMQSGQCDAYSGLNIVDFIDNIEKIADHLKNIVKAASKHFIYKDITKGKPEIINNLNNDDFLPVE